MLNGRGQGCAQPISISRFRQYRPPKPRSRQRQMYLRAHQRVKSQNPDRTRHAILLARVSNPHAMRQAPMKDEPRYPAGCEQGTSTAFHRPRQAERTSVIPVSAEAVSSGYKSFGADEHGIPPAIRVAPPSSAAQR